MKRLHPILILVLLVLPAATAAQTGTESIRISIVKAPRTSDGQTARDTSYEL